MLLGITTSDFDIINKSKDTFGKKHVVSLWKTNNFEQVV